MYKFNFNFKLSDADNGKRVRVPGPDGDGDPSTWRFVLIIGGGCFFYRKTCVRGLLSCCDQQ